MTLAHDAVVVGAGPAGAAAAALLAGGGRRVLLIDKDRFPREKVCGAFLSAGAAAGLSRVGVRADVEAEGAPIERGAVHLPGGRTVRFRLRSPGLGLSRRRLDALLADRAIALGAEASFSARAVALDGSAASGFRVLCATPDGEREITARAVVGAWGRWDALDRALGRGTAAARSQFSGWARDYEDADALLAKEVHLFVFPGGYCGLSPVEGGRAHLAGVIAERTRRAQAPGWEGALAHARRANRDLDSALSRLGTAGGFLGTGPVFFASKPPVQDGVLMAGDAAGMLDPFSGEGMASALASGILAAETVECGLSGQIALGAVPTEYAARWRARFARRFDWSARFRRLMLHPVLGRIAAPLLGETLVDLAMARLSSTGAAG